jgi:hypothetical protein
LTHPSSVGWLPSQEDIHMHKQTRLPFTRRSLDGIWHHLPEDCRKEALALFAELTANAARGVTQQPNRSQGDNDDSNTYDE